MYTMLMYVLLAVFLGGLMVGRTPEFLGKKLEAREIRLATLATVFTPFTVLVATSLALATKYGKPSIYASGPQGFSESLYAYMSQANNNGSAFAGYTGYRHALARLLEAEHFDRVIISATGDDPHVGLHGDDILWVLEHAQAEVLVLRPAQHDTRAVGAHGVHGHF
jgi:hypothetical protein